MDNSIRMYWELFYNSFSVDKLLRGLNNPIREYEDEMIEGAIIDIGCGQSELLLDFIQTDREIVAVDNEQMQLDFLKKRVESYDIGKLKNWTFQLANFPDDKLPQKEFALIIFSNILHFFKLKECIEIGKIVSGISKRGTLIYVGVHSHKYYTNDPDDPNRNDYFKHYFSTGDFEKVFPEDVFERIYCAEIAKTDPQILTDLLKNG